MSKATPPTNPDRISAAEIRELFAHLEDKMEALQAQVEQLKTGATIAAGTAPETFREMLIEQIVMSYDDKGQPTYKAKGAPYQKHGVRIWPETLPLLGVDASKLKPGPNLSTEPIKVRVLMAADEAGKLVTRKIVGRAS